MKEFGFVYWPTTLLFLNKIKTVLKNDLETFLYLKFRICFLFFDKLSLNSSFEHFCYCKKVCILKKSVNVVVNFVLGVYPQIFDLHNTFEDIIIDKHDFSDDFCKFFKSLISLDVCFDSGYFINMRKAKLYRCIFNSSEIHINFSTFSKYFNKIISEIIFFIIQ